MGQLAVVFVKYLPYSPVHRDIDFFVRFLLGKQNELHPVYLGYHVIAYPRIVGHALPGQAADNENIPHVFQGAYVGDAAFGKLR